MTSTGRPTPATVGTGATDTPTPPPLPPGTVLQPDPGLQLRDGGRILFGGAPLRLLRLTQPGATVVRRWFAGEPPPSTPAATALARRLIDAAMVHPSCPAPTGPSPVREVSVVIPVKDDAAGLDLTLASLGRSGPVEGRSLPVVVVDDGSRTPVVGPGATSPPIRVVRRPRAGGPGVARQRGLAETDTPIVAFVDAGVTMPPEALGRLARWFADPTVVAVAPRVACRPGSDPISRYEQDHSPLDLGPEPAVVGPGRALTYVPSACLLIRRRSLDRVGGFDPDLRYGEDVDLVWRLAEQGTVRYDPEVVVHHPARPSVWALARQRFGYGTSAGPLARRHGRQVAPVQLSPWSALVLLLAVVGRPGLAAGAAGATAVALARKLRGRLPDPATDAAVLTARGHWWAARSVADAGVRAWWPIPVLAAALGWGRPLRLVWALALGRRLWRSRGGPRERLGRVGLATVDDVAYGAGVWVGAGRSRAAWALLPHLWSWPGDDGEPSADGAATGR